jgi:hypothetical protein
MERLLNVDLKLCITDESKIYNFRTAQFHNVRHEADQAQGQDSCARGDVHTNIVRSLEAIRLSHKSGWEGLRASQGCGSSGFVSGHGFTRAAQPRKTRALASEVPSRPVEGL